jgi:hypothetical protein
MLQGWARRAAWPREEMAADHAHANSQTSQASCFVSCAAGLGEACRVAREEMAADHAHANSQTSQASSFFHVLQGWARHAAWLGRRWLLTMHTSNAWRNGCTGVSRSSCRHALHAGCALHAGRALHAGLGAREAAGDVAWGAWLLRGTAGYCGAGCAGAPPAASQPQSLHAALACFARRVRAEALSRPPLAAGHGLQITANAACAALPGMGSSCLLCPLCLVATVTCGGDTPALAPAPLPSCLSWHG